MFRTTVKNWRKNSQYHNTFGLASHSSKMGWGDDLYYLALEQKYILHIDTNSVYTVLIYIGFSRGKKNLWGKFRENCTIFEILSKENHIMDSNNFIIFEGKIPYCTSLYLDIFIICIYHLLRTSLNFIYFCAF